MPVNIHCLKQNTKVKSHYFHFTGLEKNVWIDQIFESIKETNEIYFHFLDEYLDPVTTLPETVRFLPLQSTYFLDEYVNTVTTSYEAVAIFSTSKYFHNMNMPPNLHVLTNLKNADPK